MSDQPGANEGAPKPAQRTNRIPRWQIGENKLMDHLRSLRQPNQSVPSSGIEQSTGPILPKESPPPPPKNRLR